MHPRRVHGRGAEITTLEGLSKDGKLHPLQQAWIEEQVPAVRVLPERPDHDGEGAARSQPAPTDAQIRQGMAGTLCRCMTYYRIQAAIKRASKTATAAAAESEQRVVA